MNDERCFGMVIEHVGQGVWDLSSPPPAKNCLNAHKYVLEYLVRTDFSNYQLFNPLSTSHCHVEKIKSLIELCNCGITCKLQK